MLHHIIHFIGVVVVIVEDVVANIIALVAIVGFVKNMLSGGNATAEA